MNRHTLPNLPYDYKALEPNISEQQLTIHHQKHHKAYVDNANVIMDKLDKARKENSDMDIKSALKSLSFNIGGHILHSLFWKNLSPKGGEPKGAIADAIKKEFGSFERFRKEFTEAAVSAEGSGWAALAYCSMTKDLAIMQIEKHNVNIYPMFSLLLVLDVWEHAYYLDYKNARAQFVENFWKITDWNEVERRFKEVKNNNN